jgi:thiol-disulfide isomerase/thioredoxin
MGKAILILFLLCGSVLSDLPSYTQVAAKAKSEDKYVVAVVTQPFCVPCVKAKRTLEDNEKLVADNGAMVAEVDVKRVVLARQFTPQLVLYSPDGSVVATTESTTKEGIQSLLNEVPLPLLEPIKLDLLPPIEQPVQASNARVIKYAIATQYKTGNYQSTFLWGEIDYYLTFMERYWNVDFQRVTKGYSLLIVQANYQLQPNAFAWAKGNTIHISPVANFGRNPRICGLVLCHEFGHCAGGSSHNAELAGIMSANGGTAGNFIPSDYRWYRPYQWRSSLRPEQEPEFMRQYFSRGAFSVEPFSVGSSNLGNYSITAPRYKIILQGPEDVNGVAP